MRDTHSVTSHINQVHTRYEGAEVATIGQGVKVVAYDRLVGRAVPVGPGAWDAIFELEARSDSGSHQRWLGVFHSEDAAVGAVLSEASDELAKWEQDFRASRGRAYWVELQPSVVRRPSHDGVLRDCADPRWSGVYCEMVPGDSGLACGEAVGWTDAGWHPTHVFKGGDGEAIACGRCHDSLGWCHSALFPWEVNDGG